MRAIRWVAFCLCAIVFHARALEVVILHDNDNESHLIDDTAPNPNLPDPERAARFVNLYAQLRAAATAGGHTVLAINGGDTFLPSPGLDASLNSGAPGNRTIYDVRVLNRINYDAINIGNHEFDVGPTFLAEFVGSSQWAVGSTPYLSSNLDFSGEAALAALVTSGRLAESRVVTKGGERFGLIGLTTPWIPQISSPGNVQVVSGVYNNPSPTPAQHDALAAFVQGKVNALIAANPGLNKIILVSHLQNINNEIELAKRLENVDLIVGAGGHEYTNNPANPGPAHPSNSGAFRDYPIQQADKNGKTTYVLTTAGEYRYVGHFKCTFNAAGEVTGFDSPVSQPRAVLSTVPPDTQTDLDVTAPVDAYVLSLAGNIIATSEVILEGRRASNGIGVRVTETNEGNLLADALLHEGKKIAQVNGLVQPTVALQNGGGMRLDSQIPAGTINELHTNQICSFSNFVAVVPNLSHAQFKEILEHVVSNVPTSNGGFAQISGFLMVVDRSRQAQLVTSAGTVTRAGERVRQVVLNDGTVIVDNGTVLAPATALSLVTNDFSARGGDNYPFRGAPFVSGAQTYQKALFNYIVEPVASGGLAGVISSAQYPFPKASRITILNGSPPKGAPLANVVAGGLQFLGEAQIPEGTLFPATGNTTLVGGLSGITYDALTANYYAISDDTGTPAPNARSPRFYRLTIDIGANNVLDNADVTFTSVITLGGATGTPFAPGTVDPEGIAILPGAPSTSVFIPSEGFNNSATPIQPFVNQFNLSTGQQGVQLPIPAKFNAAGASASAGVRHNLVFESMSFSPSGTYLFTATENARFEDGSQATPSSSSRSRIVRYNMLTGQPDGEFVYVNEPVVDDAGTNFMVNGLVELLALDDSTLLALERSFSVGFAGNKCRLYRISLAGADNVSGVNALAGTEVPVSKTLVYNFETLRDGNTANGEVGFIDNLEGMTFGPDLPDGRKLLIICSDNNFTAGQFTQFLAFAVTPEFLLLNELAIDTPEDNQEYIELKGTPGVSLNNIYFIALEGDTDEDPGEVTFVRALSGQLDPSGNGLLFIGETDSVYTNLPAGTMTIDFDFEDNLESGSDSFLLVRSSVAINDGDDFDADNDGILDSLPSDFVILDAIGYRDGTSFDKVYGGVNITTVDGDESAAASRFPGRVGRSADAWFNGDVLSQFRYDPTDGSASLPVGAHLTPGRENNIDVIVQFPPILEEGIPAAQVSVRLANAPLNSVDIQASVSDGQTLLSTDGTAFSTAVTLTFNNTTAQPLFVRAVDDTDQEGDHEAVVTFAIIEGDGGTYTTDLPVPEIFFEVSDNDFPVGVATVLPSHETAPTTQTPPDADDPAVWVHPTNPAQSLIICTQKQGGFSVYDLNGATLLDSKPGNIRYNNVDVLYGFPLQGTPTDIAVMSDRITDKFAIFRIQAATPFLVDVTDTSAPILFGGSGGADFNASAYGMCLYRSPATGKFYAFASQNSNAVVKQFELTDNAGKVRWTLVRTIALDTDDADKQVEGMVADSQLRWLYLGQEEVGIFKIDAEPSASIATVTLANAVDLVGDNGLEEDVEGLTIYYNGNGTGFLLCSSQGSNSFNVYQRQGSNNFLGSFTVGTNGGIDATQESDGADVINIPLGANFPQGLMIVQDGRNTNASGQVDGTTNFKLIPWQNVSMALALGTPDTSGYDPRKPVKDIREVQGTAHISPLNTQSVKDVYGVVTVLRSNGYYMQSPGDDGQQATSEGILVFTSTAPMVAVGDLQLVNGTVTEFRATAGPNNLTVTELTSTTRRLLRAADPVPSPVVIGAGGRVPPTAVIDNDATGDVDTSGTFDPLTDGIDFYESLEGMLVRINNARAVGPTNNFGEIAVVADNGADASTLTSRGGIVIRPGDFNPERIILDDLITANPPKVNVGHTFNAPLQGVMDYDFGNFKMLATSWPAVTSNGNVREVTNLTSSAVKLTVGTFNVENLDPSDPQQKFDALAGLIVNNLKAPDILGLEEVQDDDGARLFSPGTRRDGTPFPTAVGGPMIVNEVHFDPSASEGDANADGVVNTGHDEFIEFVNTGTAAVDISGFNIKDGTASPRLTLPGALGSSTVVLNPGQALVIFGGGTPNVSDPRFGGARVFVTGAGGLGLNNTGAESVSLNNGSTPVAIFNFDASTFGGGSTDQAITRAVDGDGTSAMVLHSTAGSTVSATQTYSKLIAAIQARDPSVVYDFRSIDPQDETDGGEPGGNIRVGFLFRSNRVSFVDRAGGTATNAVGVVSGVNGPQLTFSPGRIQPVNAAFNNSRKPLVGEFLFNGRKIFAVVNHFNSKGGDQPLFGHFQPPTLSSETQRLQQATLVANFVQSIQALDANANVIVLGDLNDFQFSPAVQKLKDVGLKTLVETLPESERYTYVFDGNSQVLDHIMASPSLALTAEYDSVHCNSEFADQDSDHDPSVARFTLPPAGKQNLRFATFNCSLNRTVAGQMKNDLMVPAGANLVTAPARETNQTARIQQIKNVAEIIQRTNPDVVLLNEFDYDPASVALLKQNFLQVSQNGAEPVTFPYHFIAESNTGIPTGFDLNNNGTAVTNPAVAGYGDDCFGFGAFPGQFGMLLLSKYPIVENNVRTFQKFLWKDMPGALLPDDPSTSNVARDWYSPAELEIFRLSSKSHWDVPILVNGAVIHALCSHPTPPVFDGPEDRNGTRNFDEIRFWKDYITGFNYMYDDKGGLGGLTPGADFVILGDQNSDPKDGDSIPAATDQLLKHPLVNTSITPSSEGAAQQAALQGGINTGHQSDPKFDTADFADTAPGNLRADYVLPSKSLTMLDARVFWPLNTDPLFRLVGLFDANLPVNQFPSSDHRMVYVDFIVGTSVIAQTLPNGVSSGDVTASTAVLWTRTTAAGNVTFDLSKEPGLTNKTTQTVAVTAGDAAVLKPSKAFFTGLTANTTYYYRVSNGTDTLTGTFKTAAAPGVTTGLRFGVSGDWRGDLAPYPSISNTIAETGQSPLNFFVKLGDTIYGDIASPASQSFTDPDQAQTLEEFRAKHVEVYGERFSQNTFSQLHAQTAILATIDDHEVTNDFAGGAPANSDPQLRFGNSTALINTTPLFNNGLQAFTDFNAIREETYGGGLRKLYRNNRYGNDAAVMLLDNRSFRDAELPAPNFGDTNSVAAFLSNSLTQNRTMLGSTQLADLKTDLMAAHTVGVTWKFVMVAEPIQNLGPVGAGDRFEGYAKERTEILKFINDNNICNVVFVAADIHGTVVNNLTYQTTPGGAQIPTSAFEITTESVAFDAPFGSTVVNLAAGLGLLTPQDVATYNGLPRAGKETFVQTLLNGQLQQFGYDPVGLQNSPIDATLLSGSYTATSTYGWTEFTIDSETQELLVTTYGINPYSATELNGNPGAVTQRVPEVVSQFVVRPAKCVDLAVTKSNGGTTLAAEAQTTYTITVTNNGPDAAEDVRVEDVLPAALTQATWTRAGAAGTRTGAGNIDDTVTLGVGQSATYTLVATVAANATGTLTNTATVKAAFGFSEGVVVNNTATDSDTILNTAPVAVDGVLAVNEDAAGSGTLAATDANGQALTFSVVVKPTKGVFAITNTATGAYTYTPTAGANGADSFTFKANDGLVDSNIATISVTINSLNDAPIAAIGGSDPLTGTSGTAVALSSQGSIDPDGTIASYTWFFGDGAMGTGASPSHTWTVAGTYMIALFVTDNSGAVSTPATKQIVISGGGPAEPPDDEDLTINKALLKLSFDKTGKDSALLQGALPVADGFSVSGKTVQVDIGGVAATFTLDSKGRAKNGANSFQLTVKATRGTVSAQNAKFLLKLSKGSFSATLADEKLDGSADVRDGQRSVKTTIVFNGVTYSTVLVLEYDAKAGKTGIAKK